jgi:hypothetical protein
VWSIVEPAPIPIEKEGNVNVRVLVTFIRELLKENILTGGNFDCACTFSHCSGRLVHITAIETIFIIYLTSLESDERSKIINRSSYASSSLDDIEVAYATDQLTAEVELMKTAIDLSDEN